MDHNPNWETSIPLTLSHEDAIAAAMKLMICVHCSKELNKKKQRNRRHRLKMGRIVDPYRGPWCNQSCYGDWKEAQAETPLMVAGLIEKRLGQLDRAILEISLRRQEVRILMQKLVDKLTQ